MHIEINDWVLLAFTVLTAYAIRKGYLVRFKWGDAQIDTSQKQGGEANLDSAAEPRPPAHREAED